MEANNGKVNALELSHAISSVLDEDWIAPSLFEIQAICGPNGTDNAEYVKDAESLGGKYDKSAGVWKRDRLVIVPRLNDIPILWFCGNNFFGFVLILTICCKFVE